MKLKRFSWIFLIAVLTVFSAAAQDDSSSLIDAANIRHLQSIAHIDFAALPEEAGVVDKGWFAVSGDGERLALINRENEVTTWDSQGIYLDKYIVTGKDSLPAIFLDASFINYRELVSLHSDGSAYYAAFHYPNPDTFPTEVVEAPVLTGVPVKVWAEIDEASHPSIYDVFLEVISNDSQRPNFILSLEKAPADSFSWLSGSPGGLPIMATRETPENDPDSYMRIGRIDPPLAITATQDALLKRWNLETGDVTATAQLDSLPASGQVNADGTFFVWVDQKFESLHLVNFETGRDQVIASLGGTYIPFLLLSAKADVIIGVNVGLEPQVVAWDVATGNRINLGKYRDCNRQPDMVRLSKDGSTLAIGCDTGLDIWRVPVQP